MLLKITTFHFFSVFHRAQWQRVFPRPSCRGVRKTGQSTLTAHCCLSFSQKTHAPLARLDLPKTLQPHSYFNRVACIAILCRDLYFVRPDHLEGWRRPGVNTARVYTNSFLCTTSTRKKSGRKRESLTKIPQRSLKWRERMHKSFRPDQQFLQ